MGGWLARQRRLEVEKTNRKLRRINNELRKRQYDVSVEQRQLITSPHNRHITAHLHWMQCVLLH